MRSYTSNQIKLNQPNKVLSVNVSNIEGVEYWPYANSGSDPWWENGSSPRYYRWEITFSVSELSHGSNLTRDDFKFNGLDIVVGDWIAGAADGKCLKISSISAKTKNSVTCIVEDVLRYNTFKASNGNGIFNSGSALVFTLNENGLPMLDPIPSSASLDFFPTVYSRFQYLNPQVNYVLYQENHNFNKGEVVSVTENGFVLANAETTSSMIGVVTETGPGPNQFMILPNNRIIDFDPAIPGKQGDKIYVDVDGTLSNVQTVTNRVAFINLLGPEPTVLTGTEPDPTIINGYSLKLNGQSITFNSGGLSSNVIQIAETINAVSNTTNAYANVVKVTTSVSSVSSGTASGLVGGYPPFSANINGTVVSFTSTGSQYTGVSTPEDMALDINDASVPNLVATATATVLTLTETAGGNIEIVNVTNDANGDPFVGASNISGLPATTVGVDANLLTLTRDDGGEILIYEDSDLFQTQTGIFSGQNGSLPLAINIEQGVRTGGTTIVENIAARDALYAIAGDQAYVLNAGLNEWGLFIYNGSNWIQTANQDSSTVDARTLVTTFTAPISGGGSTTIQNLGSISPGRKITTVSVTISEEFSGGTQPASVEVGLSTDTDLFMGKADSDLSRIEDYITLPEYVHPATATTELTVQAKLNHYTSTQGIITVKVTYL